MMEINLLIKSSIILGSAWVLLFLCKNAAPHFRFNVWKWSFILLLLLPFFNLQPILTWAPTTRIAPAAPSQLLANPSQELLPSNTTLIASHEPHISTKTTTPLKSYSWIRIIWIAGVLIMIFVLLLEFLVLNLVQRTVGEIPKNWHLILGQSKQKYAIKKSIDLVFRDQINTVFTFGFYRPTIVLPAIAKNWNDQQIQAVLLHELAHIKRNDFSNNLLIQLVKALYWFNPMVWKAAALIRLEAEQASDLLVLKSGIRPTDYGQLLVSAAKMLQPKPYPAQLSFSMTDGNALKKRMQCILNSDKAKFSIVKKLGIAAILATIGIFFSSLSLEPVHPDNLYHADPTVRIKAINSLSKDYRPSATKYLESMLQDSHYLVREKSLLALGQIASSHSFYAVRACLNDPHPKVRTATLFALAEISCLPAYREIAEAQKDSDPLVRQQAVEYLANYNRTKLMRWLKTGLKNNKYKSWICDQFMAIQRIGSQEALLELLADHDPAKVEEIRQIINQIEHPDAFQRLRRALFRS